MSEVPFGSLHRKLWERTGTDICILPRRETGKARKQRREKREESTDLLRTKPWKKKLIQPMMTICGTIITICVFIPAIIPSIAAGAVSGLGGALEDASPFGGPSFR